VNPAVLRSFITPTTSRSLPSSKALVEEFQGEILQYFAALFTNAYFAYLKIEKETSCNITRIRVETPSITPHSC
ncbi:hypothetical protein VIGAN_08285500, partial [Vigna angularis var. angularis]